MLICVILFYGCIKRCFPSSILCCCVSTYRVMQQRAVPVKEVWGGCCCDKSRSLACRYPFRSSSRLGRKKIPVDPDLSWNVSEELRKNPRIIR